MNIKNICSSISSNILIQEAIISWYQVEIINDKADFFWIKNQEKKKLFKNIDCGVNSTLANKICKHKQYTYFFLEQLGIKVPKTILLPEQNDEDQLEVLVKFEGLDYPLVVKPSDWAHWDGVTCDIMNKEMLFGAVLQAKKYSKKVLVQQFFAGFDHRILLVGGKVIAVMQRIPAFVKGDGVSTIQELIQKENANPNRQNGHNAVLTNIQVDQEVQDYLKEQHLRLEQIIAWDQIVYLRRNANLSTGGIAIDKTDDLHPTIRTMCEKLAQELNLQLCGIDYISSDISKPLAEQQWGIIEINLTPGIRGHHFPTVGQSRNVAKAILDIAFQES